MIKNIELKLNNISKSFVKIDVDSITQAVSNINMDLTNGEFVSLVGPSGCGKSTILRLISGLIYPTSGSITLNNENIVKPTEKIAMVFQKPTLFPWLTVRDNIGFGMKIKNKIDDIKIDKMIELIGLGDFKYDYPKQLSGGMAQRVALARAIINEPEILLLDEPLGALDAFTRMNMQDEILNMWKKTKCLAIMVTHDIEEAIYMSTKVVVINKNPGRIKRIIDVKLENRDRNSKEFMEYKNEILDLLK